MWSKTIIMPAVLALAGAAALTSNQAYALNDDEAAVLMGLAVGTITAVAVKHHRDHDRRDWEQRRRHYREPPRYSRYHAPQRVEHYVIHRPPQHRPYHRRYDAHPGRHYGHKRHGGYTYEYEYKVKKRGRF